MVEPAAALLEVPEGRAVAALVDPAEVPEVAQVAAREAVAQAAAEIGQGMHGMFLDDAGL